MNEIIYSEINKLGINDFLNSSQIYTNTLFPDMKLDNLFSKSINGNIFGIIRNNDFSNIFLKEIRNSIGIMSSILIIIIVHTILKTIIDGLKNSETSKIAYFIQYLMIVTIIIKSFSSVLELTRNTINDLTSFINLLLPLMTTLMLTTGSFSTTSVFQPVLLFLSSFIGNFIEDFIIPVLLVSVTFSIISNISDKIQIDRLSKTMKSFIVWTLGITLTLFTAILSLEGTLSSSVDGVASKTAKSAVSTIIPVVGKILGDTVDSVIGCSNVLKNSVGTIGIIIIIGIVALPIIKILVMWFSFKITSAICESIADEKIVKLLDQIADGYKIMLAILFSVSMMFIISITIVIKVTNSVIMYR